MIVASYDVVRSDIAFFSFVSRLRKCLFEIAFVAPVRRTIPFNYCVLDEGHVIRNPKTKLSKAIRQISAGKVCRSEEKFVVTSRVVAHRLILSGTPIQNNALELWILFDFLMPGYLGSEKQFVRRYQKPIIASSRDRDVEHGETKPIRFPSTVRRCFCRSTRHGRAAQADQTFHAASIEIRRSRRSPTENSSRLFLRSQFDSMFTLRRFRQQNQRTISMC